MIKIELKRLEITWPDRLAFTADLLVDGELIGIVQDTGHGTGMGFSPAANRHHGTYRQADDRIRSECPGQYLEGVCHDLAEQRWLSAPGHEAPAYWVSQ